MANSQNGWPVNPARSSRTIPGTTVKVTVADGPAGDVLMYVLSQVDKRVEDIDLRSTRGELDDWGFAERPIRGGVVTSNHASATAVDVNATRHVLGAVGTFTTTQVAEIHEILAEVDHTVRWGGDYSGRKDEMHFEINADHAAVARVAARLSLEDDMTPEQLLNYPIPRAGSVLAGNTTLRAVIANWDQVIEADRRRDGVLAAAVAALSKNPNLDQVAVARILDDAVKAHTPTAQENAEAQRPFLEDLVRSTVPAEQADAIVDELVARLTNPEGN